MTTKTRTAAPAAVVTVPAPKAPAKAKVPSAAAKALQERTALEAVAREFTTAELAQRLQAQTDRLGTAESNVTEALSILEAAKLAKSNQRVMLARTAYLLATHKDVCTKAHPVNILGAARVAAGETAEKKVINAMRFWLTVHVKSGEALAAKGLVFNSADPTEAERAIVEKTHDETLRAQSAKGNAKTAAKVAKGAAKGEETDADGVTKSKVETVIPTADGIIAALETVLSNIAKFKAEAGFSQEQADAIEDLLSQIATESMPVES